MQRCNWRAIWVSNTCMCTCGPATLRGWRCMCSDAASQLSSGRRSQQAKRWAGRRVCCCTAACAPVRRVAAMSSTCTGSASMAAVDAAAHERLTNAVMQTDAERVACRSVYYNAEQGVLSRPAGSMLFPASLGVFIVTTPNKLQVLSRACMHACTLRSFQACHSRCT